MNEPISEFDNRSINEPTSNQKKAAKNDSRNEPNNESHNELKNESKNDSQKEQKNGPIIGMQMYSMKRLAEYDMTKTFEDIAKIGYQAVELVGYYTYNPQQMRRNVKRFNLKVPSIHVPLRIYDEEKIMVDFEKSAEFAAEIGAKYIVIPWLPISEKFKETEIQYLVHLIGSCISISRKNGLQLVLHNYSREFKTINDEFVLEDLIGPFDKEQLQLELDFGTIYLSGIDPFKIYREYEDRTPLIHLRDITYGRRDCNLGQGKIDYAGQLHRLPHLDDKILYVEQQLDRQNGLEHARKNFEFVKEQIQRRLPPNQYQF
ncbi:sugar phosphate isomerase/epimerase family protein [Paenibacillus endoradicis]|uniref:sugar phosphate isomerase/epimerase family protein n=1 Tax=Paenibacillus endoradicis TaxID=2972487 RepID=UPI002158CC02|nr:sugar phosphate isomerase/epimerase [Paenibacillus endoradicis]MCR8659735.1 sugar phosphate isomerase/epimerase [Paenibacillus endoradicis]